HRVVQCLKATLVLELRQAGARQHQPERGVRHGPLVELAQMRVARAGAGKQRVAQVVERRPLARGREGAEGGAPEITQGTAWAVAEGWSGEVLRPRWRSTAPPAAASSARPTAARPPRRAPRRSCDGPSARRGSPARCRRGGAAAGRTARTR